MEFAFKFAFSNRLAQFDPAFKKIKLIHINFGAITCDRKLPEIFNDAQVNVLLILRSVTTWNCVTTTDALSNISSQSKGDRIQEMPSVRHQYVHVTINLCQIRGYRT